MQAAHPSGDGGPTPGTEPDQRRVGSEKGRRRHLVTLAVAVTLTLLTLPAFGISPGITLDASWVAALHVRPFAACSSGRTLCSPTAPSAF